MIRLAQEGDWRSVLEVHREAFGGDDVPRLVAELRARADLYVPALSFVAEEDGGVVGHVMNTWNRLEETAQRLLQLSPLGVRPAHQRRGHGSALVQASLDAVRTAGEPLLLVEGAPASTGDSASSARTSWDSYRRPRLSTTGHSRSRCSSRKPSCRRGMSSTRSRSGTERARARAAGRRDSGDMRPWNASLRALNDRSSRTGSRANP